MKKKTWMAVLLSLALVLSCGSGALADHNAETVTIEALIAANSRAALMDAHKSVRLTMESEIQGALTEYTEKEYTYCNDAGDVMLYDASGKWTINEIGGVSAVRYEWEAMDEQFNNDWYLEIDPVINLKTLTFDTLETVQDNGDGTLNLVLVSYEGSLAEYLADGEVSEPDATEDARVHRDIVADAETLEIRSFEEYGLRADGERRILAAFTVEYDGDAPEEALMIRETTAAFRAGTPEDPRTLTIIYNAGEKLERRYSLVADKSFLVHPITYDDYDLWYSDAERTQVFEGADGSTDQTVYAFKPGAYLYDHDPRLNTAAMRDVIADGDAVYGFRPSATGSLAMYADADWTDPALVAGGRADRIAYHRSLQSMYDTLDEMRAEGADIETIARTVSTMRNELRLAAYADDPEGLAAIKARNLEKYGHEEGPLPEESYEKYGSWEGVIAGAFNTNAGMDACLGLYDDCYDLYLSAGQLTEESVTPAQRQFAVASFVDAMGPWVEKTDARLGDFADAAEIDDCYVREWEWAVEGGFVKGYEDGTLRPTQTLRRIEAFVLVSRCLPELEVAGEPIAFTDVPDWAKADVDRLSAAGIVEGYGDGTLGAEDALTVEQVYLILRRAAALFD